MDSVLGGVWHKVPSPSTLRRFVYSGLGFCRAAVFAAAAAFILFVKLKAKLAKDNEEGRGKGDCGRTNAGSMARNSKAKGGGG